jgi:hypothetical protein
MHGLTRVFFSAVAALATYLLVVWLFWLINPPTGRLMGIRILGSLVCVMLAAWYTWRRLPSMPLGLARCIVNGSFVIGGIGFFAGFLGPIIFDPGANQGPMLGIFITGPLGFLAGMVGGALYWTARRKRTAESVSDGTRSG